MDYELAKKLKDAGFADKYTKDCKCSPLLSLSNLIEACGKDFAGLGRNEFEDGSMNKNIKSNCCHADMKIGGDDAEGTHYYVCTACGKACDGENGKEDAAHPTGNLAVDPVVKVLQDFYAYLWNPNPEGNTELIDYVECVDLCLTDPLAFTYPPMVELRHDNRGTAREK